MNWPGQSVLTADGREREKIELNRFLSDKAASFKLLFQDKAIELSLELPDEKSSCFSGSG
jgi:hypothetical protein